ncbi:FtsX-like permease family protein [Bacteroides sp. ET225]|uniref:FtsX-like permease family protein n=1 Tax=Bacteroides sp. ET225 TaxID=2972461 RepID=UPI0021AD067A|nr:FtsX-like permease family protein [Bacteroides sp. ET225]MCR8917629.1 ABC transporter permease [Bacteroides sp. ET225]
MIWKLLRQHVSVAQLVGFALANLCGMVIVLMSVQFYKDVLPVFMQGDSFMKKDYLIVSKRVSTLGSVVGRSSAFSSAEQAELEEQPFTKSVGAFTPARFRVSAGMGMQGMQLSTALFFESVPDAYVDTDLEGWSFSPGQEEIPIVLPRNYLNLYNFGFAQSRSLPQLSEGVLGMMKLDIRMSGRGQVKQMKGRIVGFSDRLNTILVPEAFMNWANATYGDQKEAGPSRLIVEVKNPADDRIAKYLKDKGYETEGDKLDAGKTTWFLKMIVGIVLAVGLVISVLSFYILMLSIYLLLQKNTKKLETLLLVGYSPARVARPYQLLTVALNAVVLALGLLVVSLVRSAYLDVLGRMFPQMKGGSMAVAVTVGIVLFLIVSAINIAAVRKKINSISN